MNSHHEQQWLEWFSKQLPFPVSKEKSESWECNLSNLPFGFLALPKTMWGEGAEMK